MAETRMIDAAALAEAFEAAADGALVPFGMGQLQSIGLQAGTRVVGPFDSKAFDAARATAAIMRSIAAVYRRAAPVTTPPPVTRTDAADLTKPAKASGPA